MLPPVHGFELAPSRRPAEEKMLIHCTVGVVMATTLLMQITQIGFWGSQSLCLFVPSEATCFYVKKLIDLVTVNPRPAGPSPDPTLCWGGGGAYRPPPSISETNRRRGKIQTAMERPGRDLSDQV